MASKKYTFKDFLRESKEALKELWIKIWGEDLPKDMTKLYPDEKYTTAEQFNLYEQDKKELSKRRRKVSIIFIIILFVSFNMFNYIKNELKFLIKNIPFIACYNKPVCIYKGSKNLYPSDFYSILKNIEPNKVLLSQNFYGNYGLFYEKDYGYYKKEPFYVNLYRNLINMSTPYVGKYITWGAHYKSGRIFEIYDLKRNKFKKLNINIPKNFNNQYNIYYSEINELIFIPKDFDENPFNREFGIYNINTDIFSTKTVKIPKDIYPKFYKLGEYENSIIYTVNCSKSTNFCEEGLENHFKNFKKNNDERLYLLNLSTLEFKPFAEFAIKPQYVPCSYDIKFLENGKIIIPIKKDTIHNKSTKYNWDHIEIYDPTINRFIAVNSTKFLDNNILDIDFENGDILFINRDSSYLFDNDTNNFIDVTAENQEFTSKILNLLKDYLWINPEYNITDKLKIIKLPQQKFIIQAQPIYHIYYVTDENLKYHDSEIPYRSIFIDYQKKIIEKGPNFPVFIRYKDVRYFIKNIDNKKILLFGGEQKMCDKVLEIYCPARYVNIIKLN